MYALNLNNIKKFLLIKKFSILLLIGILIGLLLTIYKPPLVIIPIYKFFYIKYIKIFKNNPANRFSKTELDAAIVNVKHQSWAKEQISEDLLAFSKGITEKKIDYWFNTLKRPNNMLIKITVSNNNFTIDSLPQLTYLNNYKGFYAVIKKLTNLHYIPDCKFIVALNDYLTYIPEEIKEPVAIFSFSKHTEIPIEQTTILIPDWMNISYWGVLSDRIKLASYLLPWDKKQALIHWRGGAADSMQHRAKLIALKNKLHFLDVGMNKGKDAAPFLAPEYSLQYKYQLALDGARATWERVVWQMHSNTLLIKPNSPQVQWFHKGLQPYVNYIPISDINEQQMKDLYNWLINNDNTIQKIIKNARSFAKNNLNTQDFFAYYVVLLQEYAKLMR